MHDENAPDQPSRADCGLGNCPGSLIGCTLSGDCRDAACNRNALSRRKGAPVSKRATSCAKWRRGATAPATRSSNASQIIAVRARAGKDGICPVTPTTRMPRRRLTDISTLEGTWHEKGRNCGHETRGGRVGTTPLKCRSSSWVLEASGWYHLIRWFGGHQRQTSLLDRQAQGHRGRRPGGPLHQPAAHTTRSTASTFCRSLTRTGSPTPTAVRHLLVAMPASTS